MTLLQRFNVRVERFLEKTGMAPSRFGSLALNDPQFVFDLRQGRRPNPDLIDRVDAWMKDYVPDPAPPTATASGSQRYERA